jgi:hypothetical protein
VMCQLTCCYCGTKTDMNTAWCANWLAATVAPIQIWMQRDVPTDLLLLWHQYRYEYSVMCQLTCCYCGTKTDVNAAWCTNWLAATVAPRHRGDRPVDSFVLDLMNTCSH